MNVPVENSYSLLTDNVIRILKTKPETTSFLRSLFRESISDKATVSIGVRRKTETIAVDVIPGSQGNRNTMSKSSIKTFLPPLYNEYADLTEFDVYQRAANSSNVTMDQIMEISDLSAERLLELRKKIERAYELQAAQVLTSGMVKLKNGDNVNFQRKSGSMVSKSGNKWNNNSTDPLEHLEEAAQFIRKEGNYGGGSFNVIMPSDVASALTANETFQDRADIRNMQLDRIVSPMKNAGGGTPLGETSKGTYRFILWGYDEFYNTVGGDQKPYIESGNAIVIPENPEFDFGYGAVPRVLGEGGGTSSGKFVISDAIDFRHSTHEHRIKSAGIAIPTAIDTIYTLTDLV